MVSVHVRNVRGHRRGGSAQATNFLLIMSNCRATAEPPQNYSASWPPKPAPNSPFPRRSNPSSKLLRLLPLQLFSTQQHHTFFRLHPPIRNARPLRALSQARIPRPSKL